MVLTDIFKPNLPESCLVVLRKESQSKGSEGGRRMKETARKKRTKMLLKKRMQKRSSKVRTRGRRRDGVTDRSRSMKARDRGGG